MTDRISRLHGFAAELKRRRVFRVAVAYLVVAWVAVEVAATVFPGLGLPPWSTTLVIGLALVGFPVALGLAWAFDIRPAAGSAPDPTSSSGPAVGPPSAGSRHGALSPAGSPAPDSSGAVAPSDRKSVAVLPFANLGPDPDSEYICDGITEELIGALARVSGLRVAARTSVFALRGEALDIRAVGERLGVGSAVEGSVRKAGNRLRIAAELVETDTGYHLWSRSYDRELEDIFAIQEEIARTIVARLKVRLLRPERSLVRRGTDDVEAYGRYLGGRHHLNRRTASSLARAIECFEAALDVDPEYALALAGLADTYLLLERYGVAPPGESIPRAKTAAQRAVELDDSLAEAHASLAYVHMIGDWDEPAATREFERAIELDPRYVVAHHWYGWHLAQLGRFEEALAQMDEALALEPLYLIAAANRGTILYFARRWEEARIQLASVLKVDPSFAVAHQWIGRVHEAAGRPAEAVEAYRRCLAILGEDPETVASLGHALALDGRRADAEEMLERLDAVGRDRYVSPYWRGLLLLGLGDIDAAVDALERAFEVRFDWLLFLHVDPTFDPLREHEGFRRLVTRVAEASGG